MTQSLAVSFLATTATVASGTTQIGETDNILLVGPGTSQSTLPPADAVNLPGADWVWRPGGEGSTAEFEFTFSLSGFSASTASLTGLVAVDNFVTILLNGTQIFALTTLDRDNFVTANAFGTSDAGLFNAGANTLRFNAADSALLRDLTASVSVTAIPVPLPAGFALLLAGIGGLMVVRRMRT